jgi:hypothetical protein
LPTCSSADYGSSEEDIKSGKAKEKAIPLAVGWLFRSAFKKVF